MSKLLATLGIIGSLLLGGGALYVATHQVDGKGGTTNVDSVVLNGSLTIGADANGNGVTDFATRKVLTTATTTPCAIQSPAATSTLVSTSFNITTGTSTAATLTLATSTTPYATTSLITTFTVGSGAQATPNWDGGNNNALVSPNTYLVYGAAGAANPGFTYIGTCNAVFRSVI